jgi:hypothetical protein
VQAVWKAGNAATPREQVENSREFDIPKDN